MCCSFHYAIAYNSPIDTVDEVVGIIVGVFVGEAVGVVVS